MPVFTFIVRDLSSGSTLPGAKVQVLTDVTLVDTQYSDAGGNVTTVDIPEGVYDILISKEGYHPVSCTREAIDGSLVKLSDIQLYPSTSNLYGWNSSGATWERLLTNGSGILAVCDQGEASAVAGACYAGNTGIQTIAKNGYLAVQLGNPGPSGKKIALRTVTAVAPAFANVVMDLVNGSFPAAGTSITPRNTNFGSSNISSMTAKWVLQPTDPIPGASPLWTYLIGGGILEKEFNGLIMIQPGASMVVRVVNNGTVSIQFAVMISWVETPA